LMARRSQTALKIFLVMLTTCASFAPSFPTTRHVASHRSTASVADRTSGTTMASIPSPLTAMRRVYAEASPLQEIYTTSDVQSTLMSVFSDRRQMSPDITSVTLWGAKYCRLCHRLLPRLENLALGTSVETSFFKVYHTASTHDAFELYNIQTLPSLLISRQGSPNQVLPATVDSIRWLERRLKAEGEAQYPRWLP